jgi:hypothetical protein
MSSFRAFLKRLRRDDAGNTLAICAAAIIPLTAVVGSALDLSVAYQTRSRLQNACDAGVLAARQYMQGTMYNQAVADEGRKFFDFNFPEGTAGTTGREFVLEQDAAQRSQLIASARALVPTSLMRIFGYVNIPIEVACDATRDMGHNDIVLVLDVTGSMNCPPGVSGGCGGVEQAGSKIGRLRTGAMGLYRALETDDGSVTRYGIVSYSHTVNVARSLQNKDILINQTYVNGRWNYTICNTNGTNCQNAFVDSATRPTPGNQMINGQMKRISNIVFAQQGTKTVHISNSFWNNANGAYPGNIQGFRTSGDGCIEERPSIGQSTSPFRINNSITRADVDTQAGNAGNQPELQFGRYDPFVQRGHTQDGCPSEATTLREYDSESAFQTAINAATARVTGGTYHDVGMLWGMRFLSRTGYFAGSNPTERDGIPVNQHIVFMTDGKLQTGPYLYSAHGVEQYQSRTQGSGSGDAKHTARFLSACSVAKSMGMTVWVIAFDEDDTADIEPCATSEGHFYTSDGTDLEEVFERIGQGIGNLRLTR